MASERIQRRIERLLDQIDVAEASGDWQQVLDLSRDVLAVDEDNREAHGYRQAAERRLGVSTAAPSSTPPSPRPSAEQPTSFSDGRYQGKKFMGKGGKKRVYLAHDSTLDRDVAFALIKVQARNPQGVDQ